jgi:hypothetical protein
LLQAASHRGLRRLIGRKQVLWSSGSHLDLLAELMSFSPLRRHVAVLAMLWGGGGCRSDVDVDDDVMEMTCPSGRGLASLDSGIEMEPGTLVADPLMPFPDSLLDVGIYPLAPDLSVVPERVVPYAPVWPLWSNGSDKHRYMVLPEGETIDTSEPGAWTFPPGALLFKTFLYDDGFEGCPRPVETRIMRKSPEGRWDYAVYGWDPAGEHAERLDIAEPIPIAVTGPTGAFEHHVPARIECRACHESSIGESLGLERLQLSAALGEATTHQLEDFEARGLLSHAVTAERIEHADETTFEVLGMFHGNCVHCHNGSDGPSSSFDLRHEVALANTIGRETESSASAAGIRIVPGRPEESILFLAVSGEHDDPEIKPMPPTGVDVRDEASIELLRELILGLQEDG